VIASAKDMTNRLRRRAKIQAVGRLVEEVLELLFTGLEYNWKSATTEEQSARVHHVGRDLKTALSLLDEAVPCDRALKSAQYEQLLRILSLPKSAQHGELRALVEEVEDDGDEREGKGNKEKKSEA